MDLNLKTVFDIPLNQIEPDTFSQSDISEIHQKILSEIVAGTLPMDIRDNLSPFCRLIPAPAHIRSLHEHILHAHRALQGA